MDLRRDSNAVVTYIKKHESPDIIEEGDYGSKRLSRASTIKENSGSRRDSKPVVSLRQLKNSREINASLKSRKQRFEKLM